MIKRTITMILSVLLLITFIIPSESTVKAAPEPAFSDIAGHWAESTIKLVAGKGIITGFSDGTFRPDDVVTGEQFLVMLFRAYADNKLQADGSYRLDWEDKWKIEVAKNYPAQLYSLYNAMVITKFEFIPAKTGEWGQPYVDMVYSMGLLHSFDDVFRKGTTDFTQHLKREQVSYLIGNWIERYEQGFDGQYQELAKQQGVRDYIKFSRNNTLVASNFGDVLLTGVMRGYPDGNFYPQRYVTRAEAAIIVAKLRNLVPRNPFKPDLTGFYSNEIEGYIKIYNNKEEFDNFNKIIELSDFVGDGYLHKGILEISVWNSEEDYQKAELAVKLGKLDDPNIPRGEASYGIHTTDGYHAETMFFSYDNSLSNFPRSKNIRDSWISYWVGHERVSFFLDKIRKSTPGSIDIPFTFSFDGKKFEFWNDQNFLDIEYLYDE